MGILPIFLLLGFGSASFLDFISNKRELPVGPAGRNQTELEKLFPNINISVVQQRIAMRRVELSDQLKLNTKAHNELNQRLKKYKQKPRAKVRDEGDSINEVNKKTNISSILYQGDIVLTVPQAEKLAEFNKNEETATRTKRQAYVDHFYPSTTWGRTVYYYLDNTIDGVVRSIFLKAAQFWQANTCVNFVENPNAKNKIRVFAGKGCYSYIGKIGGEQELSLGKGCESVGTAAHELGHALGFFHLQSRYDRDSYITVNIKNVEISYIDQFDKETISTNNNYGMPYDYGSVMQYGGLSASRNGQPTMIAKDIKYQDTMGSDIVGFYDVSMMNEYYKCKNNCNKNKTKCENGGFPNPRQCAVCICPSGYGGAFCSDKPLGCGATLQATSSVQKLANTVGEGSPTPLEDFSYCHYWIQAPPGKKIQVTLKSYSGYYMDGCPYGGIEIKSHQDQKLTGYRFCSNQDANTVLTSNSSLLPIITYNRILKTTVELEYKIAPETKTKTNTKKTKTFEVDTVNCKDNNHNCFVLQVFGYCEMQLVQKRCPWSCQVCS